MPINNAMFIKQAFAVLVLLCASGLNVAQEAQSEVVTSTDDLLPTVQLDEVRRREALTQIQAKLELLESSRDAYDPEIGELSLELALHLKELGYLDLALVAYRKALHIVRINYGLTSEQQLPILEQIHEVYEKSNIVEEAGFILEKILLVYQENYDPFSPAIADILERIGTWHLAAYYFELDRTPITHLIAAKDAFEVVYEIDNQNNSSEYNYDLYNRLAMTYWGLSKFRIRPDPYNDAVTLRYQAEVVEQSVNNSPHYAKAVLEKGLQVANETGDPENMIRAALMYADWSQMFNMRHTARQYYQTAYNQSALLPEDNPLRQSFSTPHALPNMDFGTFGPQKEMVGVASVLVEFDVTQWGVSRNVSICCETPPETDPDDSLEAVAEVDPKILRTAISSIRKNIYRPAFLNGQPINFEGVRQTVYVEKEQ